MTATAVADGPERPGVFRLNVTATQAGDGRTVIDVAAATGPEHFVIDDIAVYLQGVIAKQAPVETRFASSSHPSSPGVPAWSLAAAVAGLMRNS